MNACLVQLLRSAHLHVRTNQCERGTEPIFRDLGVTFTGTLCGIFGKTTDRILSVTPLLRKTVTEESCHAVPYQNGHVVIPLPT